ncbi:Csu type fimbrial protein [Hydrogenophaga sp.]|uniref:Csu type fimbrial protein n=1 Tax=Hydrogenophaga sp. TaxID=1904254 RepID=UPI003F719156
MRLTCRLRTVRWVFLAGLLASAFSSVQAQSCWVSGGIGLNFGAISATSPTDTQTNLPFTCGSGSTPAYVRVCMYIAGGSPVPDVNPRRMTNYNGSYLQYNLFSDAARTQIIGPFGGGFPEYTWTLLIPGSGGYGQASGSLPIHGRVFAGQGALPAGNYQAQIPDGQLRYVFGSGGYPANCSSGSNISLGFSGNHANVPSGCQITAVTDLDFGTLASSLTGAHDQAASVTLRCPGGTAWQIGMDNGQHHAGNRRMRNGAGGYIGYGIYRDAARTLAWGNSLGVNTVSGTGTGSPTPVTIHGRIPAQGGVSSGSYTDTVIVTLTY